MKRYNYYQAVRDDVTEWITEYLSDENINLNDGDTLEEFLNDSRDDMYDEMLVDDSVTGNASGSYTFNTWQAEENLCHNLDLLNEAYEVFDSQPDLTSPETCDVIIRCYVLSQVLDEVIDDIISSKDLLTIG